MKMDSLLTRLRATTALKGYFKPFRHEKLQQTFSNNTTSRIVTTTSREWRFIWPELPLDYPDLVLSLGTGICTKKSYGGRKKLTKTPNPQQTPRHAKDDAISLEKHWEKYVNQLPRHQSSRFSRLNPKFDETLPEMDDVSQIDQYLRRSPSGAGIQDQLRNIAAQMVASLFYFELSEPISNGASGGFLVKGAET
jgi:hypothetical protein